MLGSDDLVLVIAPNKAIPQAKSIYNFLIINTVVLFLKYLAHLNSNKGI